MVSKLCRSDTVENYLKNPDNHPDKIGPACLHKERAMRKTLPILFAFVCGFAICWIYRDSVQIHTTEPDQFDFQQDCNVYVSAEGKYPEQGQFRPHMVIIDGKKTKFSEPPADAKVWIIKVSGERIQIFATQVKFE